MSSSVKRSQAELEILKFTPVHGEWTATGVVSVLAARKLASEGLVRIVNDTADDDGVGSVVVGLLQ